MKSLNEKSYIKKCVQYREYTVPLFDLINIENPEILTGCNLILEAMEMSGMPFAVVDYNEELDNIEIKFFGFISKSDKKEMLHEIYKSYPNDKNRIKVLD